MTKPDYRQLGRQVEVAGTFTALRPGVVYLKDGRAMFITLKAAAIDVIKSQPFY